jgi:UDP-N-acetylmuramoyl-tripeptide--D-alanyl-D-alanine ligase
MREWAPKRVAAAAGATLVRDSGLRGGPERVTIDSRDAGPGVLFVGLAGENRDGGEFAAEALRAGAWGALVAPGHADALIASGHADALAAPGHADGPTAGVVLASADPLKALQALATAWRRALNAEVIGVTGSTGKTSTKDLLLALLASQRRTVASRANFNTEIGLPLEILAAPADVEVLVLEMAMRGSGQIAELTAIAEPDVGVIVSVGPVHLELLGTVENIAAAKAELIAGLSPGSVAVVPASEPLLDRHLRADLQTVTFGPGGDVSFVGEDDERVVIDAAGVRIELEVPFRQAHLRTDLLAAVAAARAVGVTPAGRVELALTPGRGESVVLSGGITIIDGCYNANPMSMRAALSDLDATAARNGARRRVAVLGDMLELGPDERRYHAELGELAHAAGVDLLITVGPRAASIAGEFDGESQALADAREAAAIVPALLHEGDVVLVKGSLGVGLKLVCEALGAR